MTAINVWAVSNGLGALAFAMLTVLLIATIRRRTEEYLLLMACAVNTVWCLMMASTFVLGISGPLLDLAEILRDLGWLAFVVWLFSRARAQPAWRAVRWASLILPAALVGFLVWRWFALAESEALAHRSVYFSIGAIAIAFWGLVLLEQLYRDVGIDERWAIKHLCLALAALFAYDFLMYSYGFVHGRVPINIWDARGAVNALVVPLIAISIRRSDTWAPNLRVSHQAAFHTSALILSGGYLLFIGLAGYYIRVFGGTWGEAVGVLFFVAMLLLLAVALFSGQVRAWTKVFVTKHFFSYKYDYRTQWLGLTRRLSTATETADPYQRSIRAVAHILECPAGALWLARDKLYVCVSNWNMLEAADVTDSRDSDFAAFLRDSRWIIDINEHARDPAHYDRVALPEQLTGLPRARLIIPLFFEQGLLGFMLLAVPRMRYTLTWEDFDLLKTLGSQVGGFLGQQESHLALEQSRQFEAFNRLTAFLMHDLKNIAAQQSLIIQNAQRHKHNPEFVDDMILTVDSSVGRMKRLLEQLQRASSQQEASRRIAVAGVIQEVLAGLRDEPRPRLETKTFTGHVFVDPERFAMIIGHVIRNAQQATGPSGHVTVTLTSDTQSVRIAVADDGCGMTPAFVRESLFKPFYSTKSSRGMGIGAYQAREFARAAGGDVDIDSGVGQGTTFTIVLPAAADNASTEAYRLATARQAI